MQRIFSSPHIIDLVLVLTLLEAIGLLLARRRLVNRSALGREVTPRPRPKGSSASAAQAETAAPPGPIEPSKPTENDPLRPIGVVRMLLPGVFLMLAIRAALDGTAWPWLPLALAAALVAHLADLRQRWFG
ncbi:hypothetical protein [Rhodopila sp.]|uniref:hypothetical protein n=1 Tax=Rhodopila sp. TaxID=2480087 RepID=UPI003D0C4728